MSLSYNFWERVHHLVWSTVWTRPVMMTFASTTINEQFHILNFPTYKACSMVCRHFWKGAAFWDPLPWLITSRSHFLIGHGMIQTWVPWLKNKHSNHMAMHPYRHSLRYKKPKRNKSKRKETTQQQCLLKHTYLLIVIITHKDLTIIK